ncbi:MAG: DUF839 domain-containing protein [Solirubrobacterales bacterium]|nr:DUF839 domain-containing protein [Solirubrobacterales bacterium]
MLAFGPSFWESLARPAKRGRSPYGRLGAPDANDLRLPDGFSSRIVARGGQPVEGTSYDWHIFSDGASTFPRKDGGWVLVSNSETPTPVDLPGEIPIGAPGEGGASAIRFAPSGEIADAYRILSGTSSNCAGGATPWRTWLSCEEIDRGQVWECDPDGEKEAKPRPALGLFKHEAVCVDRKTGFLYLSEDEGDGCLYRFRPRERGDLRRGKLEVATVAVRGEVSWNAVPDPAAEQTPTREQVPDATRFERGEGIWFDEGIVYLATTGDSTIRGYDTRLRRMRRIYDPKLIENPPLTDVDNVTVSRRSGDLFVCEDNGGEDPFDLAIITPGGPRRQIRRVARFAKLTGPRHGEPDSEAVSEVTGVCFNPQETRIYFSSQRAFGVGEIYEVRGPFRGRRS